MFIAPPSREALRERLVGRGTDSGEVIARRLEAADVELDAQDEFAHVVVNDRLEDAVRELGEIVRAAIDAVSGARAGCARRASRMGA